VAYLLDDDKLVDDKLVNNKLVEPQATNEMTKKFEEIGGNF